MNVFALILAATSLLLAQQAYQPMNRTAYTTSSFGENRGTRYHAGIDFSTQMEEGWPVLAPSDGTVEYLSISAFGYGKHLRFRAPDGHLWVFAHLSGFHPKLDSLAYRLRYAARKNNLVTEPLMPFKAGDTLAYSGSTGIGNPHLHVEWRSLRGDQYHNPCASGMICTDTVPPSLFGLAVWNSKGFTLTGTQGLDSGCARLPPGVRAQDKLNMALKIADYSRAPFENPMSIYRLSVSQGEKVLFTKRYDSLNATSMLPIRDELLWSEESDTAGDWHHLQISLDTRKPIQLSTEDFAGHTTRQEIKWNKHCPTDSTPKVRKYQDSLLFTYLARPWISLNACRSGRWELWRNPAAGKAKMLSRNLCEEHKLQSESGMLPLSQVVERWPQASTLLWIQGADTLRKVGLLALGKNKDASNTSNGITQAWKGLGKTPWTPVAAWQHLAADSSQPDRWEFHPKGLQIFGQWELCIDSSLAPRPLYWIGETSRQWFIFSKQTMQKNQRCVQLDELRDIASLSDTTAPRLGVPYTGQVMAYGRFVPSLRIPVLDDLSGADFSCLSAYDSKGKWIALDYDSEPKELVFDYARLPAPGQNLTVELCDEAGNKSRSVIQIPVPAPSVPASPPAR